MRYTVKISPVAAEFVRNLHPENKRLIKASLHELAKNPYSGKALQEEALWFQILQAETLKNYLFIASMMHKK